MRTQVAALSALLLLLAVPPRSRAQAVAPAKPSAPVAELLRYEPTGLSLLRPYARGKVPVVFVHGLWVNPWSWHRMIATLEEDPAIEGRYQFWTFGYSTGDPIPYSAHLLRGDLDEVRRKLDPDRSDPAFDRMVVVGHSMGGLLSKMMASEAGDRLWRVISDRPFGELAGEKDDLDLFRSGLFFGPRPEVRRVVYIATPHRGSRFDRGRDPAHRHAAGPRARPAAGGPRPAGDAQRADFFREHFRKAPADQHRRAGMGLADADRPRRALRRRRR